MTRHFGFTYIHCNDLSTMKAFYGDILQLKQIWEDDSSIAFKIGDHQLTITLAPGIAVPSAEFAVQPGWPGGTAPRTSWSLECNRAELNQIVAAARNAGVPSWTEQPQRVGYLSFPLLDPMNNTIEITCTDTE